MLIRKDSVLSVSIYRLYLTIWYFQDLDYLHRFGVSYMWLYVLPTYSINALLPLAQNLTT